MKTGKFKYVAMTFAILQGVLLGAYVSCNNTKHSNNQLEELSISLNSTALAYNSEGEAILQPELNANESSETPFNHIRGVSYRIEETYRMLNKTSDSAEKPDYSTNQLIVSCKSNRYSTPTVDLSKCCTSLLKQFRI